MRIALRENLRAEPHALFAALCLQLAASVSRGRCAAVAPSILLCSSLEPPRTQLERPAEGARSVLPMPWGLAKGRPALAHAISDDAPSPSQAH
jgi:hypothetical protein